MTIKQRVLQIIVIVSILMPAAAFSFDPAGFKPHTQEQFSEYWYSGRGEISRFTLEQARYGEIHAGDAVMVFVTEPMNPSLQIKTDHPGTQDIPVLKLNSVRKFFTGMYPYSVMTSVFSPVAVDKYPLPLKISASAQEWCGHVYQQMNLRDRGFRVRSHSYFEKEADKEFELAPILPEDALWNLVRLAPAALPTGEFLLIPGAVYNRFLHQKPKPQPAVGRLVAETDASIEGNPLVRYEIYFPEQQRTLKIRFETVFPYRIQSWEDTYASPKWTGGKVLTTRAVRTHTLVIDYWRHHGNPGRDFLERIGLSDREMGSHRPG